MSHATRHPDSLRTLEASASLLFLIQSLRVLFSVLFGVFYDAIFAGTLPMGGLAFILVFVCAAFLAPLAAPRRASRQALLAAAVVVAMARIPLTIDLPLLRLGSAIVIIAASGLYLATLLRQRARVFSTGLMLALAVDQLLRAAGNTCDVSLRGWWLPLQTALSVAVGWVAWRAFSAERDDGPPGHQGIGVLGGLGVGALLFLELSLLGFPNALARWTGVDYATVTPCLIAVTLLPLLIPVQRWAPWIQSHPLPRVGLLVLPPAGLAMGRLVGGPVGLTGMLAAQLVLLCVATRLDGPHRRERLGLTLAFVSFLGLNFGLAFAFTFPYTIPAFRGWGLPLFLVAAGLAALPALRPSRTLTAPGPALAPWLAAALTVALGAAFAWPPTPGQRETGPFRVATYNMHYGYDTDWRLRLEAQARAIEESGADIVALQEVDACRITSYGVDNALWLARRLGMRQVYAPTLEGLSGIALLSRFPIAQAEAWPLSSRLEPTALVRAVVEVEGGPLPVYGVWLGLEPAERERQLDDALTIIGGSSPAVLGGDLNSTPESPVYARIAGAGFDDPFLLGGLDPSPTSPAIQPRRRIDFVWARGLETRDARVLASLASDHRLVVVELAWPRP